jgi:hypothetical protein
VKTGFAAILLAVCSLTINSSQALATKKSKPKEPTRHSLDGGDKVPAEYRHLPVNALPRKFQPACAPSDAMNARCGMGAARGD